MEINLAKMSLAEMEALRKTVDHEIHTIKRENENLDWIQMKTIYEHKFVVKKSDEEQGFNRFFYILRFDEAVNHCDVVVFEDDVEEESHSVFIERPYWMSNISDNYVLLDADEVGDRLTRFMSNLNKLIESVLNDNT